ncbi:aldehyde dehydrogenase family protein [Pusillimonas sp. TS35]|nr:aldehyde dehydrogenase family protein [Pusillimonas sp. TS35]
MAKMPVRRCLVDGEWITTRKRIPNINPVNGETIGQICEADATLVDRAVKAARAARLGPWGALTVVERATVLRRIADGIAERFDDFVVAEVQDTGRPIQQARTHDIQRSIARFRAFADLINAMGDEVHESNGPDNASLITYLQRKPLGVVALIPAWNQPLLLLAASLAPALAMGNCAVAKPSARTPSSATLLAEVIRKAGLPHGVFNLIHGHGPGSAGQFLAAHPDIDAIAFSGEAQTGAAVMQAVARGVRPVIFELGGKHATVVCADADIDAALDSVLRSCFTHTGHACLGAAHVYIERPLYARFVAALQARCERLVPGYPQAPDVDLGPLISRDHRDTLLARITLACEEGATVLSGGTIPVFGDARDDGAHVLPTILAGLPETAYNLLGMPPGPVCHVAPFDADEEVIARVNTRAGALAASIWATKLARAHRIAAGFVPGHVWINTPPTLNAHIPGTDGNRQTLDAFSARSTVRVHL